MRPHSYSVSRAAQSSPSSGWRSGRGAKSVGGGAHGQQWHSGRHALTSWDQLHRCRQCHHKPLPLPSKMEWNVKVPDA